MKLTSQEEYGLRCLLRLAREGESLTIPKISQKEGISNFYVAKLMRILRRGGLVKSVRGPGGGYRLSRPSPEVRIADIIMAVDEPITATRCRQGSPKGCTGTTGRCVTHDLWEELGRHIHVFLASVSLADVIERRVLGRAHAASDGEVKADGNGTHAVAAE